jgi:hypothetical protein
LPYQRVRGRHHRCQERMDAAPSSKRSRSSRTISGRTGPEASHAHAHSNRLPKLRPHRRHVSDAAAYLGLLALRAWGLHQARQPGEIADRDAGGEGGQVGCVESLRSDGVGEDRGETEIA